MQRTAPAAAYDADFTQCAQQQAALIIAGRWTEVDSARDRISGKGGTP